MKTNTNKKIIRGTLVIGLALALGAWTYTTLMANKEAVEGRVYERDFTRNTPVQVVQVARQSLEQSRRLLGTFQPSRELDITVQAQGEVIHEAVREGEQVRAGSLIAKIDDEQLQYQLIAAEADYQDAVREAKRYEALTAGEAVPKVQLDKAELRLASTESQLKSLKKRIRQTRVTSPFNGVITTKMFEKGTVVAPGMPLAHLTDINTLKLIVQVPEAELLRFKEGEEVTVKTDVHPTASYPGTITMVGAQGDEAHNFPVHVRVSNSEEHPLRAGMYGYLQFDLSGRDETLVIPREALIGSSRDASVYLVRDSTAYKHSIRLGQTTGGDLEVLEGLQEGDQVVVNGQINLTDSTRVTIR
ncbi:efflux RND transporter periplasmic adaptor subunit [Tunicatimonas pelagia]|uniref:efflux RND transporter periplasmic adaptor subunit n=1 Tax=Tunicatimonas pelagia TaxID=931531 RepID=UPI002665BEE1|nr:efflux RND transporter periplasmic adaptor subunit [Tunicatimonas pelagia]WKN42603.1 efflux RND transporter periplasmic adaptor subunit [Tunicatimonas pelagia]